MVCKYGMVWFGMLRYFNGAPWVITFGYLIILHVLHVSECEMSLFNLDCKSNAM